MFTVTYKRSIVLWKGLIYVTSAFYADAILPLEMTSGAYRPDISLHQLLQAISVLLLSTNLASVALSIFKPGACLLKLQTYEPRRMERVAHLHVYQACALNHICMQKSQV